MSENKEICVMCGKEAEIWLRLSHANTSTTFCTECQKEIVKCAVSDPNIQMLLMEEDNGCPVCNRDFLYGEFDEFISDFKETHSDFLGKDTGGE